MLNNLLRLIQVEPVDDLPVLWAQIQKLRIPSLLDEVFPTHGLWKGELSFGKLFQLVLQPILNDVMGRVDKALATHPPVA